MKTLVLTFILLAAVSIQGQVISTNDVKKVDTKPIDFTTVLKDIDGKEVKQPNSNTALTLGDVAVTALETPLEDDKSLDGITKFKLDLLARKVYRNKSVSLQSEDITTIKNRIAKVYTNGIIGISYRLLDPATNDIK